MLEYYISVNNMSNNSIRGVLYDSDNRTSLNINSISKMIRRILTKIFEFVYMFILGGREREKKRFSHKHYIYI